MTASTPAEHRYQEACRVAVQGDYQRAAALLRELEVTADTERRRALILNDLGVLNVLVDDFSTARLRFEAAVRRDGSCQPAQSNLLFVNHEINDQAGQRPAIAVAGDDADRTKVALISFLFNWPSTGGGITHTVELARFLVYGGYQVQLFYPQYAPWGIGHVETGCPFPGQALEFDASSWTVGRIKDRFRQAVDAFAPDHVIITDCWNFKPHLADAMRGYACLLRMQAHECLCPLNNLRLLPDDRGGFRQCPEDQLAAPSACSDCLQQFGHTSGDLHRAERELSGVGTPEYQERLHAALQEAEAVLVLNPLIAETFRPHCRRVEVVTWGMDAQRFPWPLPETERREQQPCKRVLFAGLANESIKGFQVVHAACARLWEQRQDFELVATSDPVGPVDAFTRFVGWQSQQDLPEWYRAADICVVPTVAQDGLSRTAVEAMGSGRPVIASRIGGLPFTVDEGVTGLLCEPGDVVDWAETIDRLLSDDRLRERMGQAGRRQFEQAYRWESVIDKSYGPLLRTSRPLNMRP